uniref:Uncharacterized protein n=1 Tax=Plectus sambesii TaxID=2011161 RepID=A0A914UI59_9BILA
ADYSTLRTVEEIAAGFFPPPPLPPPKSIPSISTQTNSATSTTAISEGGCYSKSVVPVVSSGSHAVEALESVSVAADRPATEQEQPIPKRCTNGPQKPKRGRGRPRRIAPCILSNVPAVQHMKIFDRHSLLLRKRKQQQSMTVEKKLSESNRPTTEERQFVPFAVDDPGNRLLGGWKSAATASSGPDVIGRFASPLQPPPLGTGANRVFQDPELNALVKRHITQVKRQLAPPPSPTALYGIRQGQSAPLINSDTFCELVPIAYQLPTQANNADSSLPSSAAAYWSSQKVQFPPTAVDDWSKAAVGCAVLGDWETPTAPTIPTTMIEAIESAATSRSADDQDADVADVGKSWEDDHSLTLSEYFGL